MSAANTVSLAEFVQTNDSNFTLNEIDTEQKQTILERSLHGLETEQSAEIPDCLSCIRILSRDESALNQLTEEKTLTLLFKFAFQNIEGDHEKQTVEALKTLSNIIFKRPATIPFLRTLGVVKALLDHLRQFINQDNRNSVLLIDLKVLFILSGLEPQIRSELAKDPDALGLFASLLDTFQTDPLSTSDVELISEALKGAYNIGYALQSDPTSRQSQIHQFEVLVPTLRKLLLRQAPTSRDHFHLVNQIVNFLNIVPKRYFRLLLCSTTDSPTENSLCDMSAVDVLLGFLSHQLDVLDSKGESLPDGGSLRPDELLCPVFNVFIKGAQGNRGFRKYCRLKILPYLGSEVRHLPEEGSTLRNRLCRLLTHPLQGVSELDALMLFVLCKEDIGRAVKYTGFGNFAGFLASHALLGRSSKKRGRNAEEVAASSVNGSTAAPHFSSVIGAEDSAEEYSSASTESDTEEYARLRENVNPVTGRWELPRPNPMEGMSEEQKEYTAMELVNQIDRLQRSGLIQPGVVGDDGRVRPAEHVLELLERTKETNPSDEQNNDSDDS